MLPEENIHPRIWEYTTLKPDLTISHSIFEVTEKLDLFKRSRIKILYVLCKNYNYFNMIWILLRMTKNYRVTHHQDHYDSCC